MNTVLSKGRPRADLYQAVTDKIIAAIEAGAGEFVLPWHRRGPAIGRPTNASTLNRYQGVNVVALWAESTMRGFHSGFWATYLQWQGLGGQVRRGETSSTIVFFRKLEDGEQAEEASPEDGSRPRIVTRASRVFNSEQVDGWEPPGSPPHSEITALEGVENFVRATGAHIRHGGDMAYYHRKDDVVVVPERHRFVGTPTSSPQEAYYATVLHELTHWTGAEHRLNRQFGTRFGDQAYAMEELVADLGAAFLCADLGVTNEPRSDHAAYLANWLTVLKSDAKAIFTAARAATAGADFLSQLVSPHL